MSKRHARKPPRGQTSDTMPTAPPRPGSLARTILTALAACFVVFLCLVVASSGPVSRRYAVASWDLGGQRLSDQGSEGVAFVVGGTPVVLRHTLSPPQSGLGTLRLDVFIEQAAPVRLLLFHRNMFDSDPRLKGYDLTDAVRHAGWNEIVVTSDESPGLHRATEIGFQAVALGAPVRMAVRGARLERPSWFGRAAQMAAALFKRQPLTQGGNNFVLSPVVAGRGYGFVLWAALPIVASVLLARRFFLRERFALAPHFAIVVLVLFVLADLRNHADYLGNAREAVAKKSASSDLADYLAGHERYYPWFGDMVRYLMDKTPPGTAFTPQIDKTPPGSWQAIHRLWYYVLPRRRVWTTGEAEVAFFYNQSTEDIDRMAEWKRVDRLPNGVLVYERVKKP